MDSIYEELIGRERQRIDVLRTRIARHEARIQTLEEMAQEDEAESAAPGIRKTDGKFAEPGSAGKRLVRSGEQEFRTPSRASASTLMLLRYIGPEGKSLDDVEGFSRQSDLGMDRGAIRAFANLYRRTFGLLDAPQKGFYRLNQSGQNFLEARTDDQSSAASEEDNAEHELA